MGNRRRLRHNKQQGMTRRLISGKKPMSPEQKKFEKLKREKQSQEQKKINEMKK